MRTLKLILPNYRIQYFGWLVLLSLVLTYTTANAQRIDSASYDYPNDTLSVYTKIYKTNVFEFETISHHYLGDTLVLKICLLDYLHSTITEKDTLVRILSSQPFSTIAINVFVNGRNSSCTENSPATQKILMNIVSTKDQILLDHERIKVYPNPANSVIHVNRSEVHDINEIVIVNSSGQQIKQFNPDKRTLNIESLSPGLYFLQFKTNEGIQTQRVSIY